MNKKRKQPAVSNSSGKADEKKKVMLLAWGVNTFWQLIASGAVQYTHQSKHVQIHEASSAFLNLLVSSSRVHEMVDGCVTGLSDGEAVRMVHNFGVPVVNISSQYTGPEFPSVLTDEVATGRMAAEHLIQCGYKQFGCYLMPERQYSLKRAKGFRQTIEAAGFPCRVAVMDWSKHFVQDQFEVVNRRVIEGLLGHFTTDAGIFATELGLANRLLKTGQDLGLRVPEDFGLVSVEFKTELPSLTLMPITCVQQDIASLGFKAVELLTSIMDGGPVPSEPLFIQPIGVVTRTSTDRAGASDPQTKRALQFITDNACNQKIFANEVATAVGMSRRNLERHFRKTTGHSVFHHIQAIRIEQAKKLLCDTHMLVRQVAEVSGFKDEYQFSRIFRRLVKMSPRQYRETSIITHL